MKIMTLTILLLLIQPAVFAAGKYKIEKIYDSVFKIPILVKQKSMHKKQTMILVHGLGANGSESWDAISDEFAKHYHIVTLDLPGFGQSPGPFDVPASPESYSGLIMRIVSVYAKSKVIFVGHSMGASIGLHFMSHNPHVVDKAILIDAAGILQKTAYTKFLTKIAQNKSPEDIHLAKSAINTLNTVTDIQVENFDKFSSIKTIKTLFQENVDAQVAINLIETDFTNDLRNIQTKTLLIWGEDDPVAPVRTGKVLNFHLKKSKLIVLSNGGHAPHNKIPKEVATIVHQWLSSPKIDEFQFPESTDLNFNCNNKAMKKIISGGYRSLIFNDCSNVQLKNVSARSILLNNTVASFENVKIVSNQTGLTANESSVMTTNMVIDASVGIHTNGSKLDLAGTIINYKTDPINGSSSLIYWSTSFQSKNGQQSKTIHRKQILH
ncbi:MAG: alpha/beta hydrolase [Sulfurimonadaceae bacterium]